MGKRQHVASGVTFSTIRHPHTHALFVTLTDATTGESVRLSFPTAEEAHLADRFVTLLARAIPPTPAPRTQPAPAVTIPRPRRATTRKQVAA